MWYKEDRKREQIALVNELLRLCNECSLFSRLTMNLCAELTSTGELDHVYAASLLRFLR